MQYCLRASSACAAPDLHSITVKGIDWVGGKAVLTFASSPFDVTFHKGESQGVDVDKDGISDIEVKLNSVGNNTANLTFMSLTQKSSSAAIAAPVSTPDKSTQQAPKADFSRWWIAGAVLLIIVFMVGYKLLGRKPKAYL